MTCGEVGCCDNSPNKHATAHNHSTGHPIVRSLEPGENWFWCYEDEFAFELEQRLPARGREQAPAASPSEAAIAIAHTSVA